MTFQVDDARRDAVAPTRSVQQRRAALVTANRIRSYRKDLKRDIKRSRVSVAELLLAPPADLESMKVIDLMLAVPKVGRVKATRVLNRERISPSKTVGGLTDRQRATLVVALGSYEVSVRSRGTMGA